MKKRNRMQQQFLRGRNQQGADAPRSPGSNRDGSTLMIVIALLAMLSLVGVVFYTFAAQERANSEYFAEAAKVRQGDGLPVDIFWDWALEQLIVGPDDSLRQSALWGKNHSMVPNMFGRDAHPYSGAGVNLIADASGNIFVDQNYNGLADDGSGTPPNAEPDNTDLLNFNVSPVARDNSPPNLTTRFPRDIDVDYTYPDINNLFISYNGKGLNGSGTTFGTNLRMRRVIIPSFHRPQYLRSGGTPITDWYANANTATRVLRPHPLHRNANNSFRYLGDDGAAGTVGIDDDGDGDIDFEADGVTPDMSEVGWTGTDDFPFVPAQHASGVAQAGQMGVWTNWGATAQDDIYELDVDNDGDGIKEGVWLDLDFPVQELADGTTYIPLFSFTVIDADSLLNMNVHGNSPKIGDLSISSSSAFGSDPPATTTTQYVSKSSAGIDPGEVNLQFAFHANPNGSTWEHPGSDTSTALAAYINFFGRAPVTRQELSNMEYFFLTRGRPEFSGTDATQDDVNELYPGRYGEHLSLLLSNIRTMAGDAMNAGNFPKAGITGQNDQGTADSNIDNPQFIHPYAYNGLGSYWQSAAYRALDLHAPFAVGVNPSVWLRYDGYQRKSIPFWGQVPNGEPASNQLMTNIEVNPHLDDAMELIVEPNSLRQSDKTYGPEDTAYNQLYDSDRNTMNLTTRAEQLLPFSLGAVEPVSRLTTGRLMTAQSWDRKHFGYPRLFPGNRSWEFNRDTDGDTFGDTFPPTFEPDDWDSDPSANGTWDSDTGISREPFRDSLVSLLALVNGSSQRGRPQFRLNLNQLLYSAGGGLAYRQLTNPANNWRQAQLDRQKMCRDIYVLLYTLGGGNDGQNYANINDHSGTMTPASDVVYTRDQLRQMAQFAVNLVDAMDRDRVITIFEYDKNLGKTVDINDVTTIEHAGWNLDDDPLTDDGASIAATSFDVLGSTDTGYDADYPNDSIERGVVYGVEAQLLTLSEALWVRVPENPSHNSAITLYDEMAGAHEHMFIELRNASPFPVGMGHSSSNTAARSSWRIKLKFNETTSGMSTFPAQTRTLSFLQNAGPYNGGSTLQANVEAGGQFTIGASNGLDRFPAPGNEYRPADLRIDWDGTADGDDFPLIVPAKSDPMPPTQASTANQYGNPWTDLDLVHSRDEVLKFAINGVNSSATNKGDLLANIDDFVSDVTLILERRADLDRPTLNATQNPWVEVDRMNVDAKRLVTNTTTEVAITTELAKLTSEERREPLMRRSGDTENEFDKVAPHPAGAAGPPGSVQPDSQYNTIGVYRNSLSPTQFTSWQQHFDRDFTSVGELLNIPLYGPQDVTKHASGSQSSSNSWKHRPPRQEFSTGHYPLTAASLMLQPEHPNSAMLGVNFDNRWYRLLEFVEVPTRTHLELGNPLNITRVPGRLQWNMMRNPESWAGLLDDTNVLDFGANYLGNDPTINGYAPLPGKQEPSARDWWEQMIAARDQRDPVTGLYLPGTASSRPFRSLAYMADGNNSVEHTMLRQLPNDESSGSSHRRLLEIGNSTEHQNGSVDPTIRHRLLSKAWGNSTNRSHVFVVFISVDYFHANDDGSGNVEIGDRLDGSSVEHRGVFVVNRAQIEEAVDSNTNTIDWRKLVDFRQTIK